MRVEKRALGSPGWAAEADDVSPVVGVARAGAAFVDALQEHAAALEAQLARLAAAFPEEAAAFPRLGRPPPIFILTSILT